MQYSLVLVHTWYSSQGASLEASVIACALCSCLLHVVFAKPSFQNGSHRFPTVNLSLADVPSSPRHFYHCITAHILSSCHCLSAGDSIAWVCFLLYTLKHTRTSQNIHVLIPAPRLRETICISLALCTSIHTQGLHATQLVASLPARQLNHV